MIILGGVKNLGRDATRDLLLLSLVAGSADAAGFLGTGRVFTSNMTGNLVLLGIACGQQQWAVALNTLYVVLMFVFGVVLGSRLTRNLADQEWRRLLRRILILKRCC